MRTAEGASEKWTYLFTYLLLFQHSSTGLYLLNFNKGSS